MHFFADINKAVLQSIVVDLGGTIPDTFFVKQMSEVEYVN